MYSNSWNFVIGKSSWPVVKFLFCEAIIYVFLNLYFGRWHYNASFALEISVVKVGSFVYKSSAFSLYPSSTFRFALHLWSVCYRAHFSSLSRLYVIEFSKFWLINYKIFWKSWLYLLVCFERAKLKRKLRGKKMKTWMMNVV